MAQKLVISTVGQAQSRRQSGPESGGYSGWDSPDVGTEHAEAPSITPGEPLRHRHQIKARQARARRVIHHRRIK